MLGQCSPGTRTRFSPIRYRRHPNVPSYADCVYCGEPQDHTDHFIPLALVSRWPRVIRSRHVRSLLFTVPACASCNGIARDRAFRSYEAKRDYIRTRIRRRHAKALRWKEWEEADYVEAGFMVTNLARSLSEERSKALRRLTYTCPYDIGPLPTTGDQAAPKPVASTRRDALRGDLPVATVSEYTPPVEARESPARTERTRILRRVLGAMFGGRAS